MDRKELYKSIMCALAGLCLVFAVGICVLGEQADKSEKSMRAAYENSLYNTLDGINTVYNELCKAEFSADRDYKRELYRNISAHAGAASSRLSELPLSEESVLKTQELLNRISDYCGFLSGQEQRQEGEEENIASLRRCCERLNSALGDIGGMLGSGEDVFAADITEQTDIAWQQAEADSVSYPTLIYDGPFSQSEDIGKARVQRPEVGSVEAAAVIGFVMDADSAEVSSAEGNIPAYIFESGEKSAAVTRQGGLLLWYMDAGRQDGQGVTEEQARHEAGRFLQRAGYKDFEFVFSSSSQDSVIFNAAPVLDGAVLYPDLVKVRVSLTSGAVIGFEGSGYVINNRPRDGAEAGITLQQAAENVSGLLTVKKTRLCIIPKGNSEVLAWEFYGLYGGDKYVVYIDAATGRQSQIFRIIQTDSGEMVI